MLLLLSRSELKIANLASLLFKSTLDKKLAKPFISLGLVHLKSHGLAKLLVSL
jgi:hypothetical protein